MQDVPFIVSLSTTIFRTVGLLPLGHPLTVAMFRKSINKILFMCTHLLFLELVTDLRYEM
jgi:hypothetical protein